MGAFWWEVLYESLLLGDFVWEPFVWEILPGMTFCMRDLYERFVLEIFIGNSCGYDMFVWKILVFERGDRERCAMYVKVLKESS